MSEKWVNQTTFSFRLKAGFHTGDGVVVGVVLRGVEQYDLVKIKATELDAEH